jgi:hypothetical protein
MNKKEILNKTYDVWLYSMSRDKLKASGISEVSAYHSGGREGHRLLRRDAVHTGGNFTVLRWVSTPCILLGYFRCCGANYCFHLQGDKWLRLTLN